METYLEIDENILANFKIVDILGQGAYGVVWKAIEKASNETIALKKIFNAFTSSKDAQRTYREIMILEQLAGHPQIINLKRVIKAENNQDLYLVFEFMHTDLYKVSLSFSYHSQAIKDHLIDLSSMSIKIITHQCCLANIIHRDIKPSNILINQDLKTALADFGLSRHINSCENRDQVPLTDYVATKWYRPPELILGSQKYTKSVDIWGIGCLVAEMYLGRPIFVGNSPIDQLSKIFTIIGKPKSEDINGLQMNHVWGVIANINVNKKQKNLQQLFGNFHEDHLLDFLQQDNSNALVLTLRNDLQQKNYCNINFYLSHKGISIQILQNMVNNESSITQFKDGPSLYGLDDPNLYSIAHYQNAIYQSIIQKKKLIVKQLKKSKHAKSTKSTQDLENDNCSIGSFLTQVNQQSECAAKATSKSSFLVTSYSSSEQSFKTQKLALDKKSYKMNVKIFIQVESVDRLLPSIEVSPYKLDNGERVLLWSKQSKRSQIRKSNENSKCVSPKEIRFNLPKIQQNIQMQKVIKKMESEKVEKYRGNTQKAQISKSFAKIPNESTE